ncbi:MAG: permease, partial [Balneolales bacterium]
AFFIAGSIAVFLSQNAVIKYFGAGARKWISYSVASVSGTILAVCSCTVLPLFSGIYKQGAGLGPAIAFLYSGPAINVLAIILTARVLGWELGLARVIGAVIFSIVIGLAMHYLYRKEQQEKASMQFAGLEEDEERPMWQTAFHMVILIGILVFATWAEPGRDVGLLATIYSYKWHLVIFFGGLLAISLIYILNITRWHVLAGIVVTGVSAFLFPSSPMLTFSVAVIALGVILSFTAGEPSEWMSETWSFTKQIMPLLGAGVLVAGFLLGMPGSDGGIIPNQWIESLVGGNSLAANFFASVVGAFMYFATLTEIPILQGLIASGMGQGPALALLLAGPAVSLPNLLVIRSMLGTQKTMVFLMLVIILSTVSGLIFGTYF